MDMPINRRRLLKAGAALTTLAIAPSVRAQAKLAPPNIIKAGGDGMVDGGILSGVGSRSSAKVSTCAVALTGPVSGASAQLPGFGVPFPFPTPVGGTAVGGNEIGSAGCVGTNRPSVGGNNGSTSAQTCGDLLSFSGPQIGQISSVIGPTIINSPLAQVNVSAGPITGVLP